MDHLRSFSLGVTALSLAATVVAAQVSAPLTPPDTHRVALARHFLSASGATQTVNALVATFKKQVATLSLPDGAFEDDVRFSVWV
jgi:hypothetical protein